MATAPVYTESALVTQDNGTAEHSAAIPAVARCEQTTGRHAKSAQRDTIDANSSHNESVNLYPVRHHAVGLPTPLGSFKLSAQIPDPIWSRGCTCAAERLLLLSMGTSADFVWRR